MIIDQNVPIDTYTLIDGLSEDDSLFVYRDTDSALIRAKIRQFIESAVPSVKRFGAKGDGVTDDTGAFQDAIDASGYKRFYVPPGIYMVGELQFRAGRHMYGANGRMYRNNFQFGQTILRGLSGSREVVNVGGAHSYHIDNVVFDGVDKSMNGLSARTDEAYGGTILRCSATNCDKAYGTEAGTSRRMHSHRFIHTYGGMSNIGYSDTVDGFFDHIIADSNDEYGLYFGPNHNTNQGVNARIEWNLGYGLANVGSSRTVFTGGLYDRNFKASILLDESRNSSFVGANFSRAAAANNDVAGERSEIVFKNTCSNIAISGNVSQTGQDDGGTGTVTPRHVIEWIDAEDSVDINITANTFSQSTEANLQVGTLPTDKLTIFANSGLKDTMRGRSLNTEGDRLFQYRKPPTTITSGATENFSATGEGINTNTRAFKTLRVWARNTNGSETASVVFKGLMTRDSGSASLDFADAIGTIGTAGRITVDGIGTFIDITFSGFSADGSSFTINVENTHMTDNIQVELEIS